MEQEKSRELMDPSVYPDEGVLKTVLGESFAAYLLLLGMFAAHAMVPEWRYYNDGKYWLCKVQLKNRTIVWMAAMDGFVSATMYFAEKFRDRVNDLELSGEIRENTVTVGKVNKSQEMRFRISGDSIPADFEKFLELKIACK
ncbi:MAG: DUF3788 family protein [Spirochaetales bacterium]|nr:DUF3788 family protein [Spirochaetales bacterium]